MKLQTTMFSNRFPGKEITWLLLAAAWLLTISFIIDNYWAASSSSKAVAKNLSQHIQTVQKDFGLLASDTQLQKKFTLIYCPKKNWTNWCKKNIFFFYNRAGKLLFWNTQTILPDTSILNATDTLGFAKLQNGYYAWQKHTTSNLQLVALVPVKWNYIVINEYLQNNFVLKNIAHNAYIVSPVITENAVVHSLSGQKLFSIIEKNKEPNFRNNNASIWLRLMASVLVFFVVHLICLYFLHKRGIFLRLHCCWLPSWYLELQVIYYPYH